MQTNMSPLTDLDLVCDLSLLNHDQTPLFFSHHYSEKQFKVEFFKVVIFTDILNTIKKGV